MSTNKLRVLSVLLGLWLFATIFNIDKAFHVDDTAYLEIARWIDQHPTRPMSGLLSWGSDYEAIHYINQPPLYSYLMTLWGVLFGWSEIAMHLLMSIFTFWAIWAFYRLARIVAPDTSLLATSLLALSPAFVVGQNTMVDVPLLALWIEFFRVLLDPEVSNRRRYLWAVILCSIALLIKYTSLVLLPALAVHILLTGSVIRLAWLIVPICLLVSWSGFNYWEYGGIHMAGRPVSSKHWTAYLYSIAYWISALGAITPFSGLYFYAQHCTAASQLVRKLWLSILFIFSCLYIFFFIWMLILPARHMVNVALQGLFLITGIGLIVILISNAIQKIRFKTLKVEEWLLLCWLMTAAGFIVVLAPFIATRHVLLVLPPLMLLMNLWVLARVRIVYSSAIAVVLTAMMTGLLGSADRWYADMYRNQATLIRATLPANATIWMNGNWGWQWYAAKEGMKLYSKHPSYPAPEAGDYFVTTPGTCCALPLMDSLKLELVESIIIDRVSPVQRLASISFYASGWQAWGYSYDPIEKFNIFKVVETSQMK